MNFPMIILKRGGILSIISYNSNMFSVGLILWWYDAGWKGQWARVVGRWSKTLQFFSIGQLLRTLFAPYRQISANSGGSSFPELLHGFFDKLISRVIGFFVRSITIIVGLVVIFFQIIFETIITTFWLFIPVAPVIGAVMFAIGWVPSW